MFYCWFFFFYYLLLKGTGKTLKMAQFITGFVICFICICCGAWRQVRSNLKRARQPHGASATEESHRATLVSVHPVNRLLFAFQGMGYLHAKGIVHKDLKSKNVFHDTNKVVITDFGLFGISGVVQEDRWGTGARGETSAKRAAALLFPLEAPWLGIMVELHFGCRPACTLSLSAYAPSQRNYYYLLFCFVLFPGGRTNWSCRTAGFATWRQRSCAGWALATTKTTSRSPPRRTFTPLGRPRPLLHDYSCIIQCEYCHQRGNGAALSPRYGHFGTGWFGWVAVVVCVAAIFLYYSCWQIKLLRRHCCQEFGLRLKTDFAAHCCSMSHTPFPAARQHAIKIFSFTTQLCLSESEWTSSWWTLLHYWTRY